ncbi:MAG: peptide chain release factor-like protein [Candidatus Methylacidiphilales bacterium]
MALWPDDLIQRMEKLLIRPEDLEERFDRASGPGGQNVNKVATSVFLRHLPSGITIRSEESRHQKTNRVLARERLCQRLEAEQQAEKQLRAEARRRKRLATQPRPRKVKERILESKRRRSGTKEMRRYRP